MDKEKLKLFCRCLKELNVYGQFVHNCYTMPPHASNLSFYESSFEDRFHSKHFGEILNDSFDWSKTKEGIDFWCEIYYCLVRHEKKLITSPLSI